MKFMPEISPHYLRALAPYTSGNTTMTEALNGAADRIAELEAELAELREAAIPVLTALSVRAEEYAELGMEDEQWSYEKIHDKLKLALHRALQEQGDE